MLLALLAPGLATAQEEIPPPSGKGRVVVVLSGATGSGNYRAIATRIAALGYNVVLYDTPALAAVARNRSRDEVGNAVIAQARQMPHSLPGKVGLVGFSMGGGAALTQGTMSIDVAVVAAWYPAALDIKCCMIDKAREIAAAAKAANAPFDLTIYPGIRHGFNIQGTNYGAPSTDDALAKTAAALRLYLGG